VHLEAIASNFSHSSDDNTTSIIATNNFSISVINLNLYPIFHWGGENPMPYHFYVDALSKRQIQYIQWNTIFIINLKNKKKKKKKRSNKLMVLRLYRNSAFTHKILEQSTKLNFVSKYCQQLIVFVPHH